MPFLCSYHLEMRYELCPGISEDASACVPSSGLLPVLANFMQPALVQPERTSTTVGDLHVVGDEDGS